MMIFLAACNHGPVREKYSIILPELPGIWLEILGQPHWRLEWLNPGGKWADWEGKENFPELPLMQEWTTPVLAWPYWPEKGLHPGFMNPAGALFPWDISGNRLALSWKGGTDAFYWRELALNINIRTSSGTPRLPWYFDWPRFRELMESENIPAEVREDPWIADWKEIAFKTAESGFDRRRIKAAARTALSIPNPGGTWVGYSIFSGPTETGEDGSLRLTVRETPETWVSEYGLLRCQKNAWIFVPWK